MQLHCFLSLPHLSVGSHWDALSTSLVWMSVLQDHMNILGCTWPATDSVTLRPGWQRLIPTALITLQEHASEIGRWDHGLAHALGKLCWLFQAFTSNLYVCEWITNELLAKALLCCISVPNILSAETSGGEKVELFERTCLAYMLFGLC